MAAWVAIVIVQGVRAAGVDGCARAVPSLRASLAGGARGTVASSVAQGAIARVGAIVPVW